MKYHLARGEEQLGTFSDLDVSAGLRNGRLLPTDLCWAEGMKEWQALGEHLQRLDEEAGVTRGDPPDLTALREEVRQDRTLNVEMAPRGLRLAARLIDWTMMLVPLFVLFSAMMDAGFEAEIRDHQNDPTALIDALQRQIEKVQTAGNPTVMTMSWLMLIIVLSNVVLLGVRGQSIGKLLTGIQIVRAQDGSKAGFVKAVFLRWFLFAVIESIQVVGPILSLGNVLMIFRKDRRCLHDLVADTIVTRRNY
ncbi:RDD family protein [Prosthecobacter sp.]|uniref:RDD family protein n=1 Tax=Prosthecobacter sp. TaxID=1965333 RepID=UPI001D746594|nr:RDD family protein [Prosthecobacter sp.]MCB1275755.1 RDD family protein [Prosthecobacter sp.]